ncbi:MAG TPA: response regulator, partial [Deltaproteobacteria bacterium]|nr:response regulator [Deltaproteobacteria bacterium]
MSAHNILIVDDEGQNRDYLSEILSQEGYNVSSASNGKDAIAKLSQDAFNVVLTDLQMPELDGLGVIRYLIENNLSCIGIIFTGYGSVKTAVDAMKLGAFDYITKPFKADEI